MINKKIKLPYYGKCATQAGSEERIYVDVCVCVDTYEWLAAGQRRGEQEN